MSSPTAFTFLDLLHKEQVSIIVFSCCFGGVILDLLACLPAEIKYIYGPDLRNLAKGKLPTLPSLLLFIPRLLTIPLVALIYALVLGQTVQCTLMWKVLLTIYSVSTLNSFSIFIVRVIAIRNSKKPMIALLVFLLITHSAVLFWWLFSADFPPPLQITPTVSVCAGLGLGSISWILFIYFGTSELFILALTLFDRDWTHTKIKLDMAWKVWKSNKTSITQQFYCHTILYFILQIAFLYAEAIWFYYYGHDDILGILTAPFHLLLVLSISTRVIRSLKLYSAKANMNSPTMSQGSSVQKFLDISGKETSSERNIPTVRIGLTSPTSVFSDLCKIDEREECKAVRVNMIETDQRSMMDFAATSQDSAVTKVATEPQNSNESDMVVQQHVI